MCENAHIRPRSWAMICTAGRLGTAGTAPTSRWMELGATIVNQVYRVCLQQHPLPAEAQFCPQCGAPAADEARASAGTYPGMQPPHSFATPAPAYGAPASYGQLPYPPPVPGVYANPTNTLSNVAIGLAVVALLILPILFGPAAIVCAGVALSRKERKAGLALGLAVGGMLVGFLFGALVYASL